MPTMSPDEAIAFVEDAGHDFVKVGVFDADGVMCGKYMAREKFAAAISESFGLCDVVLGWDSADQLYDNVRATGWHTGFPDAPVRILCESARTIAFEDGMALFLGEFAGDAEAICPRGVLRRVLGQAEAMGYSVRAGFEYEFFIFEETPTTVRAKNYRDLQPMAPGAFGYSMLRATVAAEVYRELLDLCGAMRMPLEGLHEETGPGVIEAALAPADALEAADRAGLFKTFAKAVLQRRGLMATFMARWSNAEAGQSGHLHLSLADRDGMPAFADPNAPDGISATMRYFIAGQQIAHQGLLACYAPTVNSYRRLVPGFWAPTEASWGHDNRTVALRAIAGTATSRRVELRVAGADANPYLVAAAAIASGLHGIEHKLEPTAPVNGNAYGRATPRKLAFPASLEAAAARMAKSKPARTLLGDAFVDHFTASRNWEARQFAAAVTDWELARYFEII